MLLDAMAGDQMLFWRQDAVEASRELLTADSPTTAKRAAGAPPCFIPTRGKLGTARSRPVVERIVGAEEGK
jgi:glucose-6-phosphate 1-dehydrogenase